MAAQLTTSTQGLDAFDVDSVTIYRYPKSISGGSVETGKTLIYSGVADLQEDGAGETYYNEQGAVEEIDAIMMIDTQPLPAVEVDDRVTNAADGKSFAVISVATITYAFPFLLMKLRRGPIATKQPNP